VTFGFGGADGAGFFGGFFDGESADFVVIVPSYRRRR
jgi:hypothetical protein